MALGIGTVYRALRDVARLYRFWRVGLAATSFLAAFPMMPFFAPSALWLALVFFALAVRPRARASHHHMRFVFACSADDTSQSRHCRFSRVRR